MADRKKSLPLVPDATSPCSRGEVDDGLRFTHVLATQTQARVAELSANLNALTEALIASGTLSLEAYQQRRELTVPRENQRTEKEPSVILHDGPDKYTVEEASVNCAELLPICQARCCQFEVALSVQDLDERVLRWSYGRPYVIERRSDGYCVHSDGERRCSAYRQRPAICRSYDCRQDSRVWKDFERRIPADPT